MEKHSAMEWIALISGIIGASAWLPTIVPLLLAQSIEGKIISQYANVGRLPSGQDAAIFIQKVSLFSKNKDFFLKDIEVYLKFPSPHQEEKCTVWTWRNLMFSFDEDGRMVQKKLRIDAREYLVHNTILPRDQTLVGYISFSCDHLKDERYEYVKFVFIDFNGKRRQLRISGKDISDNKTIFDDSIWM